MISITIKNWDKYNPGDFKLRYPHWFRLNKDLLQSESLFTLDASERWVWIGLLCIACERKTPTIEATKHWLCHRIGVSAKILENAVEKLATANSLAIKWEPTGSSHPQNVSLHNKTDNTDITDKTDTTLPRGVFDFEALYQNYPRKIGKQAGLEKCRRLIKTESDFSALDLAIENYRKMTAGTETQYIMHFETFMSKERWRDFVNPEPQLVSKKTTLEIIQEMEAGQ